MAARSGPFADARPLVERTDASLDAEEASRMSSRLANLPEHTPVNPVVVSAKELRETTLGGLKDVPCFIWVDINGVAVVDSGRKVHRTLAYNEIASWAVESDLFKMQVVGRRGKVKSKVFVVGYHWAVVLKKTLWVTVNLYLDAPDVVRELQDAALPLEEGARVSDGPVDGAEPFGASGFLDPQVASGAKAALRSRVGSTIGSPNKAGAAAAASRSPAAPAASSATTPPHKPTALSDVSETGAKQALVEFKAQCASLQAELQAEKLRCKDLERAVSSGAGAKGEGVDALKAEVAARDRELERERGRARDLEATCEALRDEAAAAHTAAAASTEDGGKGAVDAMRERIAVLEKERAKTAEQAESLMSMLEDNQAMLDAQADGAHRAEAEAAELRAALASQNEARKLAENARAAAESNASLRSETDSAAAAAAEAATMAMAEKVRVAARGLRGMKDEVARLREMQVEVRSEAEALSTAVPLIAAMAQRDLDTFLASGAFASLKDAVARYRRECRERKRLYNILQELRGNIRVFCRVRPLSPAELREESELAEEMQSNASRAGMLAAHGSSLGAIRFPAEEEISILGERVAKTFEFDRVFRPESTQEDVFSDVAPLAVSVLDGYNVCVFAYGQTGSGKTYTMVGPKDNPGVAGRALTALFAVAAERAEDYALELTASAFEIYNESIRDLLSPPPARGAPPPAKLEVHMAPGGGTFVPGLTAERVHSAQDVEQLMERAQGARATFSTNMNEHSSRSHSVLSVACLAKNTVTGVTSIGKLHIVDLAGSERLSRSEASGERLAEALAINKSLSALGDVIAALCAKEKHVPYRNSKLTHVLQDSLGGSSKVLMFVNVSAATSNASETGCSLTFAQRARAVELGAAQRNPSAADGAGGSTPGAKSSKEESKSTSTARETPSSAKRPISARPKSAMNTSRGFGRPSLREDR